MAKVHKLIKRRSVLNVGLAYTALLMVPGLGLSGELRKFEIDIVDGHVAKAQQTLRVAEGDRITIEFTSDNAVALHLHGIDIEIELLPGETGTMSFDADTAGRFPIEAHGTGSHGGLVYVEIHPK